MNLFKYIHPEAYSNAELVEIISALDENCISLPPIEPQGVFTKKHLSTNSGFEWMKKCDFYLITKEDISVRFPEVVHKVYPDLNDFYDFLYTNASEFNPKVFPKLVGKKVLGMDTETNTLNKNIRFVGGKLISEVYMVGLCIAISPEEGYYIPIKNNELDGVKNYDWETEVKPFTQRLVDDFIPIWYNAGYDLNILRNVGIILSDNFFDIDLIGRVACKQEYEPMPIFGLKKESEFYLKRHMVELKDLLGSKENINFNRLAAIDSYVYGSSDALNTIALFLMYADEKHERNPFLNQKLAVDIVTKTVRPTIAKTTMGFPIDYKGMRQNILTVLRRLYLIESNFSEQIKEGILNSGEKVGMLVGDLLLQDWKGDTSTFMDLINVELGIESKEVTLKSGKVKRTYKLPDEAIQKTLNNIGNLEFVSEGTRAKIRKILAYLSTHRSLLHEANIYLAVLRNINHDDRGYAYINFNLRQEGTDTGRFANPTGKKGKGKDQIQVKTAGKQKNLEVSFSMGDGTLATINMQGMNANKLKLVPCRKIISMPESVFNDLETTEIQINNRFIEEINNVKVAKK